MDIYNLQGNEKPCDILNIRLEMQGLDYVDVIRVTRLGNKEVMGLILGTVNIIPEYAIALEKIFNDNAEYWLNIQNSYDLYTLRKEINDLKTPNNRVI